MYKNILKETNTQNMAKHLQIFGGKEKDNGKSVDPINNIFISYQVQPKIEDLMKVDPKVFVLYRKKHDVQKKNIQ